MRTYMDGHCDTITELMEKNENLWHNSCHISIDNLLLYDAPAQVFAIWMARKYEGLFFKKTDEAISFFKEQLEVYRPFIQLARNMNEIENNKLLNKISGLLAIEGAEALEGKMDNLFYFYDRGVRLLTLTWNYTNEVGNGCWSSNTDGLTAFGKDVIKEMNQLQMIIDVSHLNENGFWDVYRHSRQPFIASHSNSYSVCPSVRNLKDDQMKAIANVGGVIGINLYQGFLSIEETAGISHIVQHIEYILNLIGEDYIALGTDLDGDNNIAHGIRDVGDINFILDALEEAFGLEIMEKIAFKNMSRVFQEVL